MSNKKSKINFMSEGISYEAGHVYSEEEVANLDAENFEDTDEAVTTPVESTEGGAEAEAEKKPENAEAGSENAPEKKGHGISAEGVYKITNKTTGETRDVKPHTFGDGGDDDYVLFAATDLTEEQWTSPELETIRFEHKDGSGVLTNADWDIEPVA